MIGTTVSHYRITAKIGEGGMGEVYRAHDERLDRDVAIKVLPEAVAKDPDRLARFEREAKAVARLSHPNILEIHDLGEHEGRRFMVTEVLEGETLRQRLEGGSLGWRKATEIGAAIADGLAAAHASGIIHRDLKPSNVFITTDGRVKVLDFGLARTIEVAGRGDTQSPTVSHFTDPGSVLGTVGYMSPEQVRGDAADYRSDIFSLGCVLYEMLSGRRAFSHDTAVETMNAILKEPAPEVTESGADLTPELGLFVTRCLEKNPGQRFQSASDLAFALRSVLTAADRTPSDPQAVRPASSDAKLSIAVLPFENLSADPEQEYFCDGVMEEITADLSKLHSLRVISRNSAMQMKGARKGTLTISRELNVRYVLEGSVRKAGNRLRITAQLIDAPNDEHLWADKYDGTLDDIFEIQESVSRSIVEAMRLKLTPDEDRRLGGSTFDDLRAYECFIRARQELWNSSEESLDRAATLVDRGLEIVGENHRLYSLKGMICNQYVNFMLRSPDTYGAILNKAREYARRALLLNPDSPDGHVAHGFISMQCGQPGNSIRHFESSLKFDPNHPDALMLLAYLYAMAANNVAKAQRSMVSALEVDPFNPMIQCLPGIIQYVVGDFAAAVDAFREPIRDFEKSPLPNLMYAVCQACSGHVAEGVHIMDQIAKDMPGRNGDLASFLKHAWLGDKDSALGSITEDLEQAAWWDDIYPLWIADGYALTGEPDRAFHWLEHAIDYGIRNVPFLSQHDPFLENLRSDPRFDALMGKAQRLSDSLGEIQ